MQQQKFFWHCTTITRLCDSQEKQKLMGQCTQPSEGRKKIFSNCSRVTRKYTSTRTKRLLLLPNDYLTKITRNSPKLWPKCSTVPIYCNRSTLSVYRNFEECFRTFVRSVQCYSTSYVQLHTSNNTR